ncbi:MAG TPA: M20/M25/M40 family metallo-hydrolase [Terriglobales bacterium]|nr:M20/M25/M40 family metallo-hydrolase [Terriglobales bacterium]
MAPNPLRSLASQILLLIFTVMFVSDLAAQSGMERVIAEAQKPSQLEKNLQVLTDEIGGRVPHTPAMLKAISWGVSAFKEAGADSVRLESFSMPASWTEGATSVRITSPVPFTVRAVASPWTPAFTAKAPVRFVDVAHGSEEEFAKAGSIAGAIILVHSKIGTTWEDLFNDYLIAPPIIQRATAGKAAAIAFISTREHDLLYRHINGLHGEVAKLPTFIVAREDGERIARILAAGKKLSGNVSLPNRIGPAFQTANVVAEVRGSEKPDEYVIVGAHLDSWDLGTGALDNGCNAALVIDALRAIKASGQKPRRSIRFILYSGEEQGMLGSRDYALRHQSELDKIVADIVFDTGIGEVTGYSLGGRKDMQAAVTKLLAPLETFGVKEHTTDAFVGTDNLHLLLEGVPTLVANQKEANYLVNYHASSDTYDKVDLSVLRRHVVIAAATAFAIADAPERIAPRQNVSEIETLLKETALDVQLKTFGMWPEWQEMAARRK